MKIDDQNKREMREELKQVKKQIDYYKNKGSISQVDYATLSKKIRLGGSIGTGRNSEELKESSERDRENRKMLQEELDRIKRR